jgi:phosphoribosylamine--glycine ligase
MKATTFGTLSDTEVKFMDGSACCVVMASNGYPSKYDKGFEINIPDTEKDHVFVAGASLKDDKLVTSGGRVLNVTATANDLKTAIAKAYERVGKISFDNAFYRKDIGARALLAITEDK